MLVVVVEDPTDSFDDTEGSLGALLLFGYIRPEVGKASFKEAGAPVWENPPKLALNDIWDVGGEQDGCCCCGWTLFGRGFEVFLMVRNVGSSPVDPRLLERGELREDSKLMSVLISLNFFLLFIGIIPLVECRRTSGKICDSISFS